MNARNELLSRVYIVTAVIVVAATLILGRLVQVAVFQRAKWVKQGQDKTFDTQNVDAERGNILTESGAILATSLPYYELRMDLGCKAMGDNIFHNNIDSLSLCLSKTIRPHYAASYWKNKLITARVTKERYFLVADNVPYESLEKIKKFPLFREGRNVGGLINLLKSKRTLPYGSLAKRTIGYYKTGMQGVGLEGAFNNFLSGEQGQRLVQKIQGGQWVPVEEVAHVTPINGSDLITTLDENIQDIAHAELYDALSHHNAQYGCAIVMEVKTGKIRALVNLDKENGEYVENLNYAITNALEPGSTFKLASVMAMMEDGYIESVKDTVVLSRGKWKIVDRIMEDSHPHNIDSTTLLKAFAMSSNVAIARLVKKHYDDKHDAGKFIQKLKDFRLNETLGFDIVGEAKPIIKEAYSVKDFWSGTTLPWMSIGYELAITPIQLLTFYNAVANDGKIMKPYLVSEIRKHDDSDVIKSYEPTVLKKRLASRKTIRMCRELLEAVVDTGGTASNLQTKQYKIAGKTGTAQLNYSKLNVDEKFGHRSSFVGYFPADNPMYSIIVVVSEPRQNGYFGASVAGPVFRKISDRIFSRMYDQHFAYNETESKNKLPMNYATAGIQSDYSILFKELNIPFNYESRGEWSKIKKSDNKFTLIEKQMPKGKIPNVVGMGARDASYLLENLGIKVQFLGCGRIRKQSISPGTLVRSNQTIRLFLG